MAKKKAARKSKMKSYENFGAWMEDQNDDFQPLIKSLRRLVGKASAKLEETVKWGNGCWEYEELPIVFLYADKEFIQFGFFAGSMLKDPKGLLQGAGKYVRHIPVAEKKDISADYFTKLIKQAIKIKYR